MPYFTQDFIAFFQELSSNNNREWFHANKKRYEQSVKLPFKHFVEEIIDRVGADDPNVIITAKDSIFRINRDIRFSPDKTPYKTQMSAIVSAGGKKDKSVPGLYFQFGAEDARLYSGAHMLEKNTLQNIREGIAANLKEFDRLINDPPFKQKWGNIQGDKHKRLPKELKAAAEQQPLIFNKSFYYFVQLEPEIILKEELADMIMDYYFAANPLKAFFVKYMKA